MSILLEALKKAAEKNAAQDGNLDSESESRSDQGNGDKSEKGDFSHFSEEKREGEADKVGLKIKKDSEAVETKVSETLENEREGEQGLGFFHNLEENVNEQDQGKRDVYQTEVDPFDEIGEDVLSQGSILKRSNDVSVQNESYEETKKGDASFNEQVRGSYDKAQDLDESSKRPQSSEAAVSKVISHSLDFDDLRRESVFFYLRKALMLFLIPVSFALIIFYSAVQWYSSLTEGFYNKYNQTTVLSLVNDYRDVKSHQNDLDQKQSSSSVNKVVNDADEAGLSSVVSKSDQAQSAEKPEAGQVDKKANVLSRVPASYQAVSKSLLPVRQSSSRADSKSTEGEVVSLKESEVSKIKYLLSRRDLKSAEKLLAALSLKKSSKKSPKIDFLWGYLYYLKGEKLKSEKFLRSALRMDPYYQPAAELFAKLAFEEGGERSLEVLQSLYEKLPNSFIISSILANELTDQGKVDSAIRVLSKTYEINKSPDLAFNLASLYAYKGRVLKSKYFIKEALALSRSRKPSFSKRDLNDLIEYINQQEKSFRHEASQ